MKNTFKKLINIALSFIFIISSILLLEVLGTPSPSASGMSFNKANHAASTASIQDSLFFIDINNVIVNENDIYVYDKHDSLIKIVDKTTLTFKAINNNYYFSNLQEMLIYKNALLMLSSKSGSFTAISTENFSPINFIEQEKLTTLKGASKVEIFSANDKDYLLLCPSCPTSEYFEIAEISLTTRALSGTESEEVLLIDNVQKFKIFETWADLSSYENITITVIDQNLFIMMLSNNNLYSFAVEIDNISTTPYQSLTSVVGLEDFGNIKSIEPISIDNFQENLAVVYQDKIAFYKLNVTFGVNLSVNMEKSDLQIDLSHFSVTKTHFNKQTLAVISNQNQALKVFDLNSQTSEGFDAKEVENAQISPYLYGNLNFEYIKTVNDAYLLPSPYSKSSSVVIPEGSNLAVIGEGCYSSGEPIYGWQYVMFTDNNQNHYGYVNMTNIASLTETTYSKTYVTVLGYTKLYSHPSMFVDEVNQEIKTIQNSSRLEVLDPICDYTAKNTSYLLVKVNNEDVGFIDKSRVLSVSSVNDKVLPNATVTRNNSEIFTSTDSDKEIIMYLNKGDRVKVIGKRDTITNYTKVTFNDEEGNKITGYIYTHNLEPDTWSMLQIIGMILVFINVILLVIIICLKNKLTR